MLLTLACVGYLNHPRNIKPLKPLATFPRQIGQWTGEETHFDKKIYDILGVDDSFLCNYLAPGGQQVQLYIGYYQSQREGDLMHSPKNCMPGAGWNITGSSIQELDIPGSQPERIKVIQLILEKGTDRLMALYWFQSRGRYIASEYMQKIYLVADSIFRHRTDGSFVRLISPIVGGDENRALDSLKNFSGLLIPILREYIPS